MTPTPADFDKAFRLLFPELADKPRSHIDALEFSHKSTEQMDRIACALAEEREHRKERSLSGFDAAAEIVNIAFGETAILLGLEVTMRERMRDRSIRTQRAVWGEL